MVPVYLFNKPFKENVLKEHFHFHFNTSLVRLYWLLVATVFKSNQNTSTFCRGNRYMMLCLKIIERELGKEIIKENITANRKCIINKK